MSMKNRHDLLARVSSERRDFLKKISIAAAFAAPAMATISLDGVRKKAFAQQAYDPPEVFTFEQRSDTQAVVTFTQPMQETAPDVARGSAPSCRTTWTENFDGTPFVWTWEGDTKQVVTFSAACETMGSPTLHVTYNESGCVGTRFVGKNGLDLVPYSGQITLYEGCPE